MGNQSVEIADLVREDERGGRWLKELEHFEKRVKGNAIRERDADVRSDIGDEIIKKKIDAWYIFLRKRLCNGSSLYPVIGK